MQFATVAQPLAVSDPNGTLATAAPVSFIRGSAPVSKSGIIVQTNDADLYKLSLLSGDSLQLAVSAQSIGSPLASRLRVFDAAGNELGSCRELNSAIRA